MFPKEKFFARHGALAAARSAEAGFLSLIAFNADNDGIAKVGANAAMDSGEPKVRTAIVLLLIRVNE